LLLEASNIAPFLNHGKTPAFIYFSINGIEFPRRVTQNGLFLLILNAEEKIHLAGLPVLCQRNPDVYFRILEENGLVTVTLTKSRIEIIDH